jgi:hypothetical protein
MLSSIGSITSSLWYLVKVVELARRGELGSPHTRTPTDSLSPARSDPNDTAPTIASTGREAGELSGLREHLGSD